MKTCESRQRIYEYRFQKVWFKIVLEHANILGKTLNVSVIYIVFTHNSSPYTQIMAIYYLTNCSV